MDDERTQPPDLGRVHARTSDRVAGMSEAEREELARELARRRRARVDSPVREPEPVVNPPSRRPTKLPDPAVAERAARLTADLQRTERRLYLLERALSRSRSRYQMADGGPPSARHARLLSRADRLERQLRDLG